MLAIAIPIATCREKTHKDEWHHGQQPRTLAEAAHGNGAHGGLENELKLTEQERGDGSDGLSEHASVEQMGKVPNNGAAVTIRQRVADNPPLDRTGHDDE